ncbi:mannose-6-phosphate isomerase, class I [Algibacter mikhailovii]|uniref:mannose-6-phosphate isomerase n=1 Tax=Algibacter mikhailovii TaxID=425498 RepID=A0A918R3U2_9FLAO|nr:mannose-6-phosphate isomerase, class I [Algibacter mikhailovii]GGZ85693.1 mannose-6-phosphate isomerase [Algibacter mikhailovii]
MSKLFTLTGKIQNYAWGGTQYIPNLLDLEAGEEPCAEYWLGAHINAPSILDTIEGEQSLDDYLNLNLSERLGADIAEKFGRLPFLFKVLDVSDMLSIQVHPSKIEAEKGFKYENEKGIPLNAFSRNYKDDNHKPEIMVALSEFWLLHGFLPKEKLIQVLKSIPEFSNLLSVFNETGYFGLYKQVMQQSDEESNALLQPIINRILPLYKTGKLDKSNPDYWAAKAVDTSENKKSLDKGIYSIYFFNIVKVNKGEAVFQDAGIPHAYLEGQNMELMANSDNVLRGGLTPKHVDVPELLKHVVFEETEPNIMLGELQDDGLERIYKSPAPDFELSQISICATDKYMSKAMTAQIIIVIEGHVEVSEGKTVLALGKGQSAFLSADSAYTVSTPNSAILYKATAP